MSWINFKKAWSARYRVRAAGAVAVALALIFGIAVPPGLPELTGAVAQAQTSEILGADSGVTRDSGESTVTLESKLATSGILKSVDVVIKNPQQSVVESLVLFVDGTKYVSSEKIDSESNENELTFDIPNQNVKAGSDIHLVAMVTGAADRLDISYTAKGDKIVAGPDSDVSTSVKETASSTAREASSDVAAPTDPVNPAAPGDPVPPAESVAPANTASPSAPEAQTAPRPMIAPRAAAPMAAGASGFIPVEGINGLSLKVDVSNTTPKVNEKVTFTYTLKNDGPSDIWWGGPGSNIHNYAPLVLTDALCQNPQYVNYSFSTSPNYRGIKSGNTAQITCDVTFLRSGKKTNTITIRQGEFWSGNSLLSTFSDARMADLQLVNVLGADNVCTTGSKVVSRQAARELTNAERQRGTSVYVTASQPNGQARNSSQIYLQTSVSGNFVPIGNRTNWIINALAYNQQDNWLYAISQGRIGVDQNGKNTTAANGFQALFYEDPCYPAGHLLQINPVSGEIYDLGKVKPGAGTVATSTDGYGFQGEYGQAWPNDLWGGINVGFIGANNQFWVANGSLSGTGALYKIDLTSVSAITSYKFDKQVRYPGDYGKYWRTASEDYAVLPGLSGNFAWGIVNGWNSDGGKKIYIERIDLSTGSSQRWDITNLRTPTGQSIPLSHQWSKAWVYGDGTLGFGTGSNGSNSDVIRIKVQHADNSPTFSLESVRSNAPAAYNTNGTSNGYASPFSTDLEMIKRREEIKDGRIYWWIDVWNNGPDGISGFTLRDQTTSDFSDIRREQVVDNTGLNIPYVFSEDAGSTNLTGEFGTLPPRVKGDMRPQLSVLVSAKINGAPNDRCVANTAVVVNNETDTNIQNNTFTSTCAVKVEKLPADVNKDGTVDDRDVQGPDTSGNYTATYDVKVTNTGTEKTSYNKVIDTPKFPDAFTVKDVQVKKPGWSAFGRLKSEPDGSYILGSSGVLEGGKSDTYQVKVTFSADRSKLGVNPGLSKCSNQSAGLFNIAKVDGAADDACVDFPTPKDLPVNIVKMAADGTTQPIPGAEFVIYPANQDGTLDIANTTPIIPNNDGGGKFATNLNAPAVYYLVETKAPEGLSLLSQPIKFGVSWDEGGIPQLQVLDGGSSLIIGGTNADDTVALIKIFDVKSQSGTLPKTGGFGVWLWALVGLLVVGVGGIVARRRTA